MLAGIRDRWLTESKFAHVPSLDGLRAVAIGIVFLGHAGLGRVFIPGGFGVTIFFFLSGFLITSLLRVEMATTGKIDLKGFYTRRSLRIMPPLWLSILVLGAGSAAGLLPSALDPIAILLQLFFGINYGEALGHADGVPGMPLWSLAVEEHYYLVFPAVFLLLARRLDVRSMAKIFAIACGAALALRAVHVLVFGDSYYTYYFTHTRFDSILFGAILGLWNNPVLERSAWRPSKWQVAAALLLLAVTIIPRNEIFRETIRYSLQGMLLFVLFSWILGSRSFIARLLESRPFQVIGAYSYTIYLSHYFFIKAIRHVDPSMNKVAVAALAALFTLTYSAVMYKFVERPAGLLRRKLNARQARTRRKTADVLAMPSALRPASERLVGERTSIRLGARAASPSTLRQE